MFNDLPTLIQLESPAKLGTATLPSVVILLVMLLSDIKCAGVFPLAKDVTTASVLVLEDMMIVLSYVCNVVLRVA